MPRAFKRKKFSGKSGTKFRRGYTDTGVRKAPSAKALSRFLQTVCTSVNSVPQGYRSGVPNIRKVVTRSYGVYDFVGDNSAKNIVLTPMDITDPFAATGAVKGNGVTLLSALYTSYIVPRFRVMYRLLKTSSPQAIYNWHFAAPGTGNAALCDTVPEARRQGLKVKFIPVGLYDVSTTDSAGGNMYQRGPWRHSGWIQSKKYLDQSGATITIGNSVAALTSTSPANQVGFYIYLVNINETAFTTADAQTCDIEIMIEQEVVYWGVKDTDDI